MTEFEAFMCGLIMGEGTSYQPRSTGGPKLIRNIALQDVAFCQCLRNIVDSLEEYVRESHPSPKEFIKHLLPKTEFEQPYTTEEKKIIDRNKRQVEDYVEWIETKIKSKKLVGGDKWESLGAVRMIWQDKVYTPDFDHLDLLFGDELLSKPKKYNGRLYEYNSHDPAHFSGLATGFFNSVPARIIELICYECSQQIVKKYGFDFDRTRFDYDRNADKGDTLDEWRKESRPKAYKLLLKDMPSFCKATWSDYTVVIKDFEAYKHSERKPISKEEEQRRKTEARKVCARLTADECKQYAVDTIKNTPSVYTIIGIIVMLTIAMVIILALVSSSVPENVGEILEGIIFGGIGTSIIVILTLIIITTGPLKKYGGVDRKVYEYITVLQDAFYNNYNEKCAKKYAEFLERVNGNQETDDK